MKKLLVICFIVLLLGCESEDESEKISDDNFVENKRVEQVVLDRPFIIEEILTFEKVRNYNLIKDNGSREHLIILPPSFYDSDNTYPIVYYFHGQDNTSEQIKHYQRHLYKEMLDGEIKEAVIVGINYNNKLGVSFMTNSPVTGMWQDAFFEEAVPFFEEKYRIDGNRSLFGFSVGGNVALRLGFEFPDLIDGIYILAPAIFKDEQLSDVLEDDTDGYGMAFVYNESNERLYDLPSFDGSDDDNQIIDRWKSGYMGIDQKIENYLNQDTSLSKIGIELGITDRNREIVSGTKYFVEQLSKNDIDYFYKETNNGHNINKEIFLRAITYLVND
ncbi:MAG: hypothetical protein JEZ08_18165 [Clostridiales bacterium]|nr:hypothetical protein [Clostridiales bacterium]